jgi:hypothetical protein
MPKRTRLSSGTFNEQHLLVELLQPPAEQRASVRINWPPLATVCSPTQFDAVVATTGTLSRRSHRISCDASGRETVSHI